MSDLAASDFGKGWADPWHGRKAHWFNDEGRSLCGKYGSMGFTGDRFDVSLDPSPDDCAPCRRKLDRLIAEAG